LVSFLRGFVMITAITYVSVFVYFALQENTDAVRNTLYGLLIPMVIGAGLGGGLLPKLGYRPIMTTGMLLMALGAGLLTTVTASTPSFTGFVGGTPPGLFLFLMPVGFGIGMTFAPATIVVQNAVPKKDIGISTSLVQFMMNIGGAFGVSLLSTYQQNRFAALSPPAGPPTPAYFAALQSAAVTSIHELFVILAVVAVFAFLPALFVTGKLVPHAKEEPAPMVAG
jgi:MFS family permease